MKLLELFRVYHAALTAAIVARTQRYGNRERDLSYRDGFIDGWNALANLRRANTDVADLMAKKEAV